MRIEVDLTALKQTRWHEMLVRFCLGGLITAATGIIAKKYGPGAGGLFLAFPAIFPAGATLIEKHERERRQKAGLDGSEAARKAAAVDAAGAAMGSVGLFIFALLISQLLPEYEPWMVILGGAFSWASASVFFWLIQEYQWRPSNISDQRSPTRRPPFS